MKTKQQILDFFKEDRIKFGTVSGILTTKPNLIEWVDQNIPEIELITSKSYQVNPNPGNREPIFIEMAVGDFANAVGLKNPGMEQGYKDLAELQKRHNLRSILNVSLSANSIEDFITLVKKFEDIADILELNFSCPHAIPGYGSSIGCDAAVVAEYMKEIRKVTSALLFPKLTPNTKNIGEIAKAAVETGADGISAINTVGPDVHVEPHTGQPILYNPKGHKGGKSGGWIKEIAVEKIREVREAVGPDIPIIGMGGVTTGEDVVKMREAGADVVGIGSVTARVRQSLLPKFFAALKRDADVTTPSPSLKRRGDVSPPLRGWVRGGAIGQSTADQYPTKERLAEYKSFKIKKIIEKVEGLKIFELDGQMDYRASQFAFIWVPDVGEKPFAIAKAEPLTFIVREREYDPENKKGVVTHAIFQLQEGDEMMARGIYGADAPDSSKNNAYIVAGGTGIAIVPKLTEKLEKQGKKVVVYCGAKHKHEAAFGEEIANCASYIPVPDNGVIARVLEVMKEDLKKENINDTCFYNVGPVPLMSRAMEIQKKLGADAKDIFVSLETNNMCGMGVCGECECGGVLTCQEGTFFSLDFFESKKIDILKL